MQAPPPLPWQIRTAPERLTVILAAAVLFIAAVSLLARNAHVPLPGCLWRCVTGWPCAGCGGTRALDSLLRGSATDALLFNPVVVLCVPVFSLGACYAAGVLVFRLEPWRPSWARPCFWRVLLLAGLCANWFYLLLAGRV
jgi:hypothetical protein